MERISFPMPRKEGPAKTKKPEVAKNHEKSHIGKKHKYKTVKQTLSQLLLNSPEFISLYRRVATKPQIKVCDITGMKCHYICPRTGVQYHSAEVYARLREMPLETAKAYAGIRRIGQSLSRFAGR